MKKIITFILPVVCAALLFSCEKEDKYSTHAPLVGFSQRTYLFGGTSKNKEIEIPVQFIANTALSEDLVLTIENLGVENIGALGATFGTIPSTVKIPAGEFFAKLAISVDGATTLGKLDSLKVKLRISSTTATVSGDLGTTEIIITAADGFNKPVYAKTFTALEGKTLPDTIGFSLNKGYWKDYKTVDWSKSYYTINSNPAQTLITLTTPKDKDGADSLDARFFSFNVAALGLSQKDTVKLTIIASENGVDDTIETKFAIAPDKLKKQSTYDFTAANFLSTATPASFTKTDSAKTFFGVLSNSAIKGLDAVAIAEKGSKQPVFFLAPSGGGIGLVDYYAEPTSDYAIEYQQLPDISSFDENNRLKAEDEFENGSFTAIQTPLIGSYYVVKITQGTAIYYGYLKLNRIDWGESSYVLRFTLNYDEKRNNAKE